MWCVRPAPDCVLVLFPAASATDCSPLSLHDALPISPRSVRSTSVLRKRPSSPCNSERSRPDEARSEEHTSELQSLRHLVCRLLLEKKKKRPRETNRAQPPRIDAHPRNRSRKCTDTRA